MLLTHSAPPHSSSLLISSSLTTFGRRRYCNRLTTFAIIIIIIIIIIIRGRSLTLSPSLMSAPPPLIASLLSLPSSDVPTILIPRRNIPSLDRVVSDGDDDAVASSSPDPRKEKRWYGNVPTQHSTSTLSMNTVWVGPIGHTALVLYFSIVTYIISCFDDGSSRWWW